MENEYLNEQNRKILLPKLFRVTKTLNKMMEDRGYTVEESQKELIKIILHDYISNISKELKLVPMTSGYFFPT
jgi:hypothetical protein